MILEFINILITLYGVTVGIIGTCIILWEIFGKIKSVYQIIDYWDKREYYFNKIKSWFTGYDIISSTNTFLYDNDSNISNDDFTSSDHNQINAIGKDFDFNPVNPWSNKTSDVPFTI